MKKVIGIISLLLSVTLATANPIDFDKAFKESAKIEKQIKRTSFPKRTYLITDFVQNPIRRMNLAMRLSPGHPDMQPERRRNGRST